MSKESVKALIDEKIYGNGEQKITGPILNNVLNTMVDESGGAISGFEYLDDISDLPDPPLNPTIGYIIGDNLYVYVGEGGDTLGGLYQNVGPFVGPAGTPGPQGLGFDSITTNQDGTIVITLTNGDQITIDLNHEHPQYPKYHLCTDQAEYDAISTKDSATLYLIPE